MAITLLLHLVLWTDNSIYLWLVIGWFCICHGGDRGERIHKKLFSEVELTDPPVGPQQEFLCLMSFKPIEWDRIQFRKKQRKALVSDQRTENYQRLWSTRSPQDAMAGRFKWLSSAGKGWSSRETSGAVLPMFWISARAHRLCTRPDAAFTILRGGVMSLFLFPAAGLKQSVFTRNSRLDFPLGGLCM